MFLLVDELPDGPSLCDLTHRQPIETLSAHHTIVQTNAWDIWPYPNEADTVCKINDIPKFRESSKNRIYY